MYYNGLFDVPNPDRTLRPSMTAEVHIVLNSAENAIVVPSGAVGPALADGRRTGRVLEADGRVSARVNSASASTTTSRRPGALGPSTRRPRGAGERASEMTAPLLELEGVAREYPAGEGSFAALKDVSLTIQAGECVAIMGPSGSGKSTLMNILGCLDRPTAGVYRASPAATLRTSIPTSSRRSAARASASSFSAITCCPP